jgi:cobalt-precorrin 5A hydrolase / precorrin-3B C17-methyltransferase
MSPAILALGIGADSGVSAAELHALIQDTLAAHNLSPRDIACIASIDGKQDEAALLALARSLGVPTRFLDVETLRAEAPRLKNPSARVQAATGVPGIAEAAALAAAGPGSELIVPKTKSSHATCAVARRART